MSTRYGLLLPHEEGPGLAPVTWASIRDTALQAEDLGLDSVWLVDHVLWQGDPWQRDKQLGIVEHLPYGVTECWTTLAGVAAVTDRVKLGTVVTCTAYRSPALLAKMADTVDSISDGRVILGLGAGDYVEEHDMLGVPSDRPFARFEEALAIILPLLKTGQVDFRGEFYEAREMQLRPRGLRPTGPPIMIGSLAQGPRSLRIIAEQADIFNTWMMSYTVEEISGVHDRVDAACEKHGRDPGTLERYLGVPIQFEGPPMPLPGVLKGSEEEIAESLAQIKADRVDEVQAILLPTTPRTVEALGRIIDLVNASQ